MQFLRGVEVNIILHTQLKWGCMTYDVTKGYVTEATGWGRKDGIIHTRLQHQSFVLDATSPLLLDLIVMYTSTLNIYLSSLNLIVVYISLI